MNEKIQSIIHDPKTKNVAIGVGVVAGITGVVYAVRYIKRRRAEKTVVFVPNKAERAKMEIDLEDIPILYESSIDQKVQTFIQDKVDNRLVSESLIEAMITGEEPEEVIMQNVFTQVTDPEWDYEEEVKNRKPSEPYIIHRDEFFSDEMDFLQSTFTYYAGDNILIDEDDTPIYNHEIVTGPLNFGHGSGDSNVIRDS